MNLRDAICDYLQSQMPRTIWSTYREVFITGRALGIEDKDKFISISFHPDNVRIADAAGAGDKTVLEYSHPDLPEQILADAQRRHQRFLAKREHKARYITTYLTLDRANLEYLGHNVPGADYCDYSNLINRLIQDRCRSYADWRAKHPGQ